jgi:LysR family transcriptional regulator, benzoate and cis,cis-muconate-responsive activator of ben and cat genes
MSNLTELDRPANSEGGTHPALELRHLRYLVAIADAGKFTLAAERLLISQPTLSQQIRRLEEMVGTPLLQRRREGATLTRAGCALVEEARTIISLLDHGVSRSRHIGGLGRSRLRFVLPPHLPEWLAVETASRLRSTAAAADADVAWLETPLDGEFSLIRQRRADAGLGWLASADAVPPDPLDIMSVAEFQPELWIPRASAAGKRGILTLEDLAQMQVIHGPRRISAGTYDAWLAILQARQPRFEFTDPPFRHSLPTTLAFAAMASRPTAVLTGPSQATAGQEAHARDDQAAHCYDMIRVDLERRPLTATAVLAWSCDLPRHLQQVLFETAEGMPSCRSSAAA